MTDSFPSIQFRGELRPSQQDVVAIARRKLSEGRRRLYIVAPPGSGKTVLGLYLWAQCVRRPALVLSPNTAIQSQWAARLDLFHIDGGGRNVVSTDPAAPALFTSLTYQSVTLPRRVCGALDDDALELWCDKLIESGQAEDPTEAQVWLDDLARHNRQYYERRLASYRKQVRDEASLGGQTLELLHRSAHEALTRLKQRRVGLIILDECHHLLGHWGRVLADAHQLLDQPLVVGLTATPPDVEGKQPEDVKRYDNFFGEVDYEVPVPAIVKDGFLAPYQDLAYFVRPTSAELAFVAGADKKLHQIVEDLCRPGSGAGAADEPDGGDSVETQSDRLQPAETSVNPIQFEPQLQDDVSDAHADAPEVASDSGAAEPHAVRREPPLAVQIPEPLTAWVYETLMLRRFPTGAVKDWPAFARRDPEFSLAGRLFLLRRGVELPEEIPLPELDLEPQDVPEMEVLAPVLDRFVRHRLRRSPQVEDRQLAEQVVARLRTLGVQITDTGMRACASPVGRVLAYSRAKANALVDILRAEMESLGPSIRVVVVADYEKTSAVTAEVSHLLDDESGGAVAAFRALLADEQTDSLDPILVTGSSVLVDDDLAPEFDAAAAEWLAQAGCEVKLRFGQEAGFHIISGSGGDWCPRVYVAMITELFQRGLTRCLVGTRGLLGEGWDANKINVLVDLTSVTTSMSVNQLRGRSIRLDPDDPAKVANNWDVVCIAPEFAKGLDDYRRFIAKHKTIFGVTDDGAVEKGVGHVHAAFTELRPEGLEGSVSLLNADMLARAQRRTAARELWRIGEPYHNEPVTAIETQLPAAGGAFPPFRKAREPWSGRSLANAIGRAVLDSLIEISIVQSDPAIHAADRAGGYVRLFLENASERDSDVFAQALHEALGPLRRPRYVIERVADHYSDTLLSKLLPDVVGRFFRQRERKRVMLHAVPSVLSRNKDLAAIYQKHWNKHVSPGEPVYAHRGAGERLIEQARRAGQTPRAAVQEKEVFR